MTGEPVSSRGRVPTLAEEVLRERLTSESVQDRRDAAVGLVDVATDGLEPATTRTLVDCLQSDPDPEVRQFAVEALGVAGGPGEAIESALEDDHEWVRAEMVVAHSRARPEQPDPLRACLDDESGWVRRNAVIALGKAGAVDQSTLVECIKRDAHPPVREYAAQFLPSTVEDRQSAVRILAALLAKDPDAFVRSKAAESLGDIATERAQEALRSQGLPDRSDAVQRAAKRALAAAEGVDPETLDLPDTPTPGGGPDRPSERSPEQPASRFGGEPR